MSHGFSCFVLTVELGCVIDISRLTWQVQAGGTFPDDVGRGHSACVGSAGPPKHIINL